MKDYKGSRLLSVAAYGWGFVALAATLFVSWRFNSHLSADPVDSIAQGFAALIADFGPVILVVALAVGIKQRIWPLAALTGLALAFFLSLSFLNVLGYSSTGSFAKVENAKLAHAAAVAAADKQNEMIKQGLDKQLDALRSEARAASRRKDRVGSELALTQLGMSVVTAPPLAQAPAETIADPQAVMISRRSGLSEDDARDARAAAMSLALIFSKLFGFGLGAYFWRAREEIAAAAAVPAPAPVAHEVSAPIEAPALQVVNDNVEPDVIEEDRMVASLMAEDEDMFAIRARNAAHVRAFLDECTVRSPGNVMNASQLYRGYMRWAGEDEALTQTMFGRLLNLEAAERGVQRQRDSRGGKNYTGIALLVDGMPIATAA